MSKKTHAEALITKQNILDSAFVLFSENGYDKTSLTDIAKHAGLTRGAIYWHFADKGDILCELCMRLAQKINLRDDLMEACDIAEQDPLSKIRAWLKAHANNEAIRFLTSAFASMVDSIIYGNVGDEVIRQKLNTLIDQRTYFIKEALKNAVNRKQLPDDLDIDLATMYLHTILIGHCQYSKGKNLSKGFLSHPVAVEAIMFTLRTLRKI